MSEVMRQMPARAGRAGVARGEAVSQPASDEAEGPRHEATDTGSALLQAALTRDNLQRALKRVRANKGAAGVDGLGIDQTVEHLVTAWPGIREQLLRGDYRPSPVRRVEIPKPEGGQRELGIPTVVDRLIQQALLQVLQPILDPTISEHSHGFRPGRRAQDAVLAAQAYVQSGRTVVVDVDLEKFFDRVNHDILIDACEDALPTPESSGWCGRTWTAGSWMAGWSRNGIRARRKAGRCRRCWPTSCSTKWTRNWNDGATASRATPMTATCTCAVAGLASG